MYIRMIARRLPQIVDEIKLFLIRRIALELVESLAVVGRPSQLMAALVKAFGLVFGLGEMEWSCQRRVSPLLRIHKAEEKQGVYVCTYDGAFESVHGALDAIGVAVRRQIKRLIHVALKQQRGNRSHGPQYVCIQLALGRDCLSETSVQAAYIDSGVILTTRTPRTIAHGRAVCTGSKLTATSPTAIN